MTADTRNRGFTAVPESDTREEIRSSGSSIEAAAPLDFPSVYREHLDFTWRTVRRMHVDAASVDDVVQDVFVVVHRRLAEYDRRTALRGWIYGIAVRVAADHRRRIRRKDARCTSIEEDPRGIERVVSTAPPPSQATEHGETLGLLERILGELTPEHREVVILSRLEEMNAVEIADALGVNVNTIYSRLRTANERFDAIYARYRAEDEENGK